MILQHEVHRHSTHLQGAARAPRAQAVHATILMFLSFKGYGVTRMHLSCNACVRTPMLPSASERARILTLQLSNVCVENQMRLSWSEHVRDLTRLSLSPLAYQSITITSVLHPYNIKLPRDKAPPRGRVQCQRGIDRLL